MKSQVKKKEINFLEIDGYTKNVYTAEFKNRASFRNGALHIVDKYDLNAVYIIYMNETNTESYIIKCPVVNSSKSHYDIQIKYRDNIISNDAIKYVGGDNYRVKKKDIDCNIYTSSTYDVALLRLLQLQKSEILTKLEKTDDKDIYKLFIEASKDGLFFGLEFIAKYLKLDYIFRFEDDTK